jgi:predicted metal-dependent phosphoesterase TrpH
VAPKFELQSHSTYSDGELAPAGVVAAAAAAGVELLALSDHDSVEGVPEASEAARATGLALVSAVEISSIDPIAADIHILGYLIDPSHPELRRALERSRADRELRSLRMGDALRELGFELDDELLAARAAAGKTIGRPHLAQAVVTQPANAARLRDAGLTEASAFLEAYLIEGRPAFREREAPSVSDAIDLIHEAGGVAIWAHPFWDVADPAEVLTALDRFTDTGLDGVEAFYVTHTRDQTELLADRSGELGILSTGSSDFHGPGHRRFNRFRAFDTYGRSPNLGPIAADPSKASEEARS